MRGRMVAVAAVVGVLLLAIGFVGGRATADEDPAAPTTAPAAAGAERSGCQSAVQTASTAVNRLEQAVLTASAAVGAGGTQDTGRSVAALAASRAAVEDARSQLQAVQLRCGVVGD